MPRVFHRGKGYLTNSTEAIALKSFKTLFQQILFQFCCIFISVILEELFTVGVQTYIFLAALGRK